MDQEGVNYWRYRMHKETSQQTGTTGKVYNQTRPLLEELLTVVGQEIAYWTIKLVIVVVTSHITTYIYAVKNRASTDKS